MTYRSWCRACGREVPWDALEDQECADCREGDTE